MWRRSSLIIAAIFTLFVGLCFAELCSMMPVAGGAYIYVRRAMSKFGGFIAGWLLVLAYAAMMPGECIIIGKLVAGIIPGAPVAWVGVATAIIFTVINLVGITFSAIVQLVLTVILFAGMFIYAIPGFFQIDAANLMPFFGRGAAGMLLMVPIYFLAFMGYDILPQAAEEVKSPVRKMVFVIPLSIVFVLLAYLAVAITNAGVLPWEQIAKSTEPVPIMSIATKILGPSGPAIIIIIFQIIRKVSVQHIEIEDEALFKISELIAYAMFLNLFLLSAELYKEYYSQTVHIASFKYLFEGLHGHKQLVPWIWAAMAMNVIAFFLFLVPAKQNHTGKTSSLRKLLPKSFHHSMGMVPLFLIRNDETANDGKNSFGDFSLMNQPTAVEDHHNPHQEHDLGEEVDEPGETTVDCLAKSTIAVRAARRSDAPTDQGAGM
jgi:amino acid transporter